MPLCGSSANIKIQLHKIEQLGGFMGLNDLIAPIKRLVSLPEFIDDKLRNVLKNKDKISDTIKAVASSIKDIKELFGAGITLTDN